MAATKAQMTKIQVNPGSTITQGNNPWIDAVTYNAQWQKNDWSKPVQLRVSFLQPRRFSAIRRLPQAKDKLSDPTFQGWNPSDPASRFPGPVQQAYLNAYQAWSDVALIGAKATKATKKADVVFVLANYNNDGYVSGDSGPQLQGSHQGLLRRGNNGFEAKPAIEPLISDANASVVQDLLQPGGGGIEPGSRFFKTAIHEIGHGIGLSHPHDRGLGSVPSGVFPGLTPNDSMGEYGTGLYALNQTPFTVMTYVRGFDDGSAVRGASSALTPMALDVMAAQLKYGVNNNSRPEDNIYDLGDVMILDTWQCIWDTGGDDTITGEKIENKLVINLRPAEMNAVRPETGSPYERYDWGVASQWAEVLDTLLGLTSTRMGFMLGSGVVEAYKLQYYLDQIYSRDQQLWGDVREQILEPLSGDLSQLRKSSFDYSDWSRAIATIAGGQLSSLASALSEQARTSTSKQERRTLTVAANAAERFEALNSLLADLDGYVDSLQLNERISYEAGLTEARASQNEIMSRSAPGVAGHVSTLRAESDRFYGNRGGFTIAAGVTIENAAGGKNDDEIIGNAADNRLFGNGGDDLIDGYLGNNLIDGGSGTDTAVLIGDLSEYTFSGSEDNLIASNIIRGYESTLISIEAIRIGALTATPAELLEPFA